MKFRPSAASLSGTPAEAGVRDDAGRHCFRRGLVSVEPLPKQGCEMAEDAMESVPGVVSVEPLPKQGCEDAMESVPTSESEVSVEPLPKQGYEEDVSTES